MREAHTGFDRKMALLIDSGSQTGEMLFSYVEMKHILKFFFLIMEKAGNPKK